MEKKVRWEVIESMSEDLSFSSIERDSCVSPAMWTANGMHLGKSLDGLNGVQRQNLFLQWRLSSNFCLCSARPIPKSNFVQSTRNSQCKFDKFKNENQMTPVH